MAYCVKNGHYLKALPGGLGVPGGVWMEGTLLEFHPVAIVWGLWAASMVSKTLRIPKL